MHPVQVLTAFHYISAAGSLFNQPVAPGLKIW